MRSQPLLLAVSLGFIGACRSDPGSQLRQMRQELASWDATAKLTAELSRRGDLPSAYGRQVSEAVEQGKQQARQRAAKISR